MNDKARLEGALREVSATEWQWRAAGILLGVNGIKNALEYTRMLGKKRKPQQLTLKLEER